MSLVLATNRPEDLDPAVLDRVDVTINIGLPGTEERRSLIRLYHELHFETADLRRSSSVFAGAKKLKSFELKDGTLARLASSTEGFSGREISKLFVALYNSAVISPGKSLTEKILEEVQEVKRREHHDLMTFLDRKREIANISRCK